MKKVVFVINNLETGGVQKSLLNLLKETHSKYEITLLTFWGNEEFENELPDGVNVIKTRSSFRQLGISAKDAKRTPFLYVERAFYVLLTRIFGRSFVIKLMSFGRKRYTGYDVAISFIHEASQKNLYGGCNEFVLNMIDAERKVTWLHCDFGLCGANNSKSKRIYEKFDTIVACSEGCKRAFLNCLPEFSNKTVSIRNCNDYDNIRALAGDGIPYDKSYFNIVTVARLSEEKGIERALIAVGECIKRGFNIKYHVVGSGDQENFLWEKTAELGIGDSVVFYGNKQNPYPYMKNADLFLLTSYHEAAPMVFDEAACLGVPVLATETTSTDEMLVLSSAGFVCENSQIGINIALFDILSNRDRVDAVSVKLKELDLTNKEIIDSIEKCI